MKRLILILIFAISGTIAQSQILSPIAVLTNKLKVDEVTNIPNGNVLYLFEVPNDEYILFAITSNDTIVTTIKVFGISVLNESINFFNSKFVKSADLVWLDYTTGIKYEIEIRKNDNAFILTASLFD